MPSDHRLHPSSVVFQIGGQLKNLLVPGLVALFAARAAESMWQVWAMLLLIPYTAAAIVRALSTRYRFDPAELVISTGFLFRRERRIPYDRIHNIDAIQNVAHRLLNVMEVRLETAGGTDTEAELKVLSVPAFQEMRQRVHAGRGETVAHGAEVGSPVVAPAATRLLQLRPREVALLGLLEGRGFVVLSAAFGVLWELGLVDRIGRLFGTDAAGRGVFRQFVRALVGQGSPPTQQIAMMLAAFVAFLVAMRVLSIGLALVRFYGFVLARVREELRSEFGLLTRVTSTIPMRRIQMLTVHWGPLHRLFRRAAVRVDTAGGHGEQVVQAQRQWIVPIVREQVLPGLVRAILPVADTTTLEWRMVHPRAFRRAVIRPLFLTTALSLALIALLHWWTIAAWAVLSLWTIAATKRYVDSLRWALTDSTVAFRSGWLWRYLSIAPLAKVQAVSLHESPFDRRHGMATVLVDTAGGHDAPHRLVIPFLPREAAATLREHLVASAAHTAFRW